MIASVVLEDLDPPRINVEADLTREISTEARSGTR
jgi:hypothetical protein